MRRNRVAIWLMMITMMLSATVYAEGEVPVTDTASNSVNNMPSSEQCDSDNITVNAKWEDEYYDDELGYSYYELLLNDDKETYTLVISGEWCGNVGVPNDDSITDIIIEEGVEIIDSYAFDGYSQLERVKLPDSLTTIGYSAFRECWELLELTGGKNVIEVEEEAFKGCSQLESIPFSGAITDIGDSAFYGCSNLTEVKFPKCSYIGYFAFMECSSITDIDLQKCKVIGDYAFRDCKADVHLGKEIEYVGEEAFYGCSMDELVIPGCMESVDGFQNCQIKDIVLEKGVEFIMDGAFSGNSVLESISFPITLEEVGENVFTDSKDSLKKVKVQDYDTWLKIAFSGDYSNPLYCKNAQLILEKPLEDNYRIPNVVSVIPAYTFRNNTQLKSISIPSSVTIIGEDAFRGCENLRQVNYLSDDISGWCMMDFGGEYGNPLNASSSCELTLNGKKKSSVVLADYVTEIPAYTFRNWGALERIGIPEYVESIGENAFYGCTDLRYVDSLSENPSNWCNIKFSNKYANPLFCSSQCELRLNGNTKSNVSISDDATTIPTGTFRNWDSLERISIPESVSSIGEDAFYGCKNLRRVDSRAEDISNWCNIDFANEYSNPLCISKLCELRLNGGMNTNVVLADGVKEIPDYTFRNWNLLENITMSPEITSVGRDVFEGCTSLSKVNVDNAAHWIGIKFVSDSASNPLRQGNVALRLKKGREYTPLTILELPDSVSDIPDYAFAGQKSLTSVELEGNLRSIGEGAFRGCQNLKGITINWADEQGDASNSEADTGVIGNSAFEDCIKLEQVSINGTSDSTYGKDIFKNCSDELMIIGVKDSAVERYANKHGIKFQESTGIISGNLCDGISYKVVGNILTIYGYGSIPDYSLETAPFVSLDSEIRDDITTVRIRGTEQGGITKLGANLLVGISNVKTIDIDIASTIEELGENAFGDNKETKIRCYSVIYEYLSKTVANMGKNFSVEKRSGGYIGNISWNLDEDSKALMLSSDGSDYSGYSAASSPFESLDCNEVIFTNAYACQDIPANLFKGCYNIREVRLSPSIKTIGDSAFEGCTSLYSITCYDGIEGIGRRAFYGCKDLSQISIDGNEIVNEDGAAYENSGVIIPDGVSVIPEDCFVNCKSITSVTMPENLASIETGAFAGCSNLNELSVSDSKYIIKDRAFSGCTALSGSADEPLVLNNCSEIQSDAFINCSSLKGVWLTQSIENLGENSLGYQKNSKGEYSKVNGMTIYAPQSAAIVAAYCKDKFKCISTDGIGDVTSTPDVSVSLRYSSVSLKKNKSQTIKFTSKGTVVGMSASSSGSGRARVVRKGNSIVVKGIASGKATVNLKFRFSNNKTAKKTLYVTVKSGAASACEIQTIRTVNSVSLHEKEASQISIAGAKTDLAVIEDLVDGLKYDKSIASVTVNGSRISIKGNKPGTTYLTLCAQEDETYFESNPITIKIVVKDSRPSQKLTVSTSAQNISYSKLKKKSLTVKPVRKVSGAKGRITYSKVSGSKQFTVNKTTGKVTAKKKTRKGTYKIKVKISAAATSKYKATSKTVGLTIKVK